VDRLEECEELSGPGQAALKVVGSEAQRVTRLLKHLLDSSKAESITEGLSFRVCHPGELLEGLSGTLKMKAEALNLTSQLDLDPAGDSAWVLMDAEAMQQVLFNLIENALKFTPAPGTLGIRSRLAPAAWILEVWDTGRGIETAQAAELFQPFNQAREADAALGWGLGLSICRALVEAHEGSIEVESTPGQGSTFRVALPLVTP
jgi:signal transduction histidine kinase